MVNIGPQTEPAELFFSYSHEDEKLRDQLAKHLKLLERQGVLSSWHDRKIGAGQDWANEINEHVQSADVILLLISPDFLASDYCFDIEMRAALQRHDGGDALVIPVILRPVNWQSAPFAKLEALPKNGKPVTTFDNRDVAFQDIEAGIRRAVQASSSTVRSSQGQLHPPAKKSVDLLPVSEQSPLLLGIAIDVSGSMQTSIAPDQNRLQAVLDALKDIAKRSTEAEAVSEVGQILKAVKLFAYGFGFADRTADYGPLAGAAARLLGVPMATAPSKVYRGAVRDLLDMSGLGTQSVRLTEVGQKWQQIEQRLWDQRYDLFGDTPMKAALTEVMRRFEREFTAYTGVPRSILIVISDGDSTDGSPIEACSAITELGTVVVGMYLTSIDVVEPRRLYGKPEIAWPSGARALFEMSSSLGEDVLAMNLLRSKGWTAQPGDRLFVQLNQSEIISELVNSVLEMQSQGTDGPRR